MKELELIDRIRARVDPGAGVAVGIGDDAAVLKPAPGMDLVATTDNLVAGRHFDESCSPGELGYLALAVNLSDLAAMGAAPRWALLTLTLPVADRNWLDAFLDGFLELAGNYGCTLVGGNLARGPLNIAVTALGEVEPGRAARRTGGRVGDRIVVTGTLGDAAAALELGEAAPAALRRRLVRPEPRVEAGRVLAGHARAMIDVSDGLVSDLGKILPAESGAEVACADLPASAELASAVTDAFGRWRLQAGGGGDYELLALIRPEANLEALAGECGTALSEIGRVNEAGGIRLIDPEGKSFEPGDSGWDHFRQP